MNLVAALLDGLPLPSKPLPALLCLNSSRAEAARTDYPRPGARVHVQSRLSCSCIHSSSKFLGTPPNDFKIVALSKFPMLGSPLRLNASAPALAGSRDIDSAPSDRGPFVGHLLRLAKCADALSQKRQGYVVYDGH